MTLTETCSQSSEGYGCAVDLWALGVVTYIILYRESPFSDEIPAIAPEVPRAFKRQQDIVEWRVPRRECPVPSVVLRKAAVARAHQQAANHYLQL